MRTPALTTIGLLAVASSLAASLAAQPSSRPVIPEVRPLVGVYVPTGSMRDDFRTATMLGLQGAFELSRSVHLTATTSWTRGHNRFAMSTGRTNLWQYDLGVEANVVRRLGERWQLHPFAGLGVGGRTYDYRAKGVATKTCTAGYGALGGELQKAAVALRLEGRDYVSCFESPVTGAQSTRNDVAVALGLAYHVR
jgi:hypothetical protein